MYVKKNSFSVPTYIFCVFFNIGRKKKECFILLFFKKLKKKMIKLLRIEKLNWRSHDGYEFNRVPFLPKLDVRDEKFVERNLSVNKVAPRSVQSE